jgi:hypothetical protein
MSDRGIILLEHEGASIATRRFPRDERETKSWAAPPVHSPAMWCLVLSFVMPPWCITRKPRNRTAGNHKQIQEATRQTCTPGWLTMFPAQVDFPGPRGGPLETQNRWQNKMYEATGIAGTEVRCQRLHTLCLATCSGPSRGPPRGPGTPTYAGNIINQTGVEGAGRVLH